MDSSDRREVFNGWPALAEFSKQIGQPLLPAIKITQIHPEGNSASSFLNTPATLFLDSSSLWPVGKKAEKERSLYPGGHNFPFL